MLYLLLAAGLSVGDVPKDVDYLRDVKPLLAARCFACHGAIKQKGDLRVDTAASLREGGNKGPAIVPGDSKKSLLIERILGRGGQKRMPPEDAGEALKPAEVERLARWIDQGAIAPKDERPETDPADHWAFKVPLRPPVPKVKNAGWVRNPVDAFLAQKHEELGLAPQAPVEKSLLLRRVYLDLIGLPPTAAELEAFQKDDAPDAYEKVVERLLASPHYGERWGRHWMDVWRYSDWWGLGAELRNSQRHIWHWRDWIVESLNQDKGYDRMLLEMLAADELYPTDDGALRGTGFLARHYFKFNRTTWLDETIEHTSKAFLGLTINCSKCHDHKYDPITQVDYYRFRAFFEPYQVRTDMIPGETDFEKNGIPRVFDCNLATPTFLHVRGDEAQPDKERKITPGLPVLLAHKGLAIREVKLPAEAHHPGLKAFVLKNHAAAAEKQLKEGRVSLEKAKEQLARAAVKEVTPKADPAAKPIVTDDFATLNKERWLIGGGTWEVDKGVVQRVDGPNRAALTLKGDVPADFEAHVQFSILGGKEYKSVGLAFDVGGDHESLVYLTAHAPAPRVQFAFKKGASYEYPADGQQSRKVPLDVPQEMRIRVRGNLLNVSLNREHAFAFTLPARHAGAIALITFDASARFHRFALAPLPAETTLIMPGGKAAGPVSLAEAKLAVSVAEKRIAAAEALIASVNARAAADRARLTEAADAKSASRDAALAEKQHALAQAELALAEAEQNQLRPKEKTDPAALLKKAQANLEAARKALAAPGETYTPLAGALKTLESNLETEESRRKPFPTTSTGRRSALARWIASTKNPLTARVAVNHIWLRHFGEPLVASVFDFGRKGAVPSHPELLDWLACELMAPTFFPPDAKERPSAWSMKHLHRLLVTSSAYRITTSRADAAQANEKDPDNHYLWRMNPQRMESQVVRDSLLHLAGELDLTPGGPTVDPPQQEMSRRRSLYFFHSAIDRNRFLATFDEADPLDCYRRRESVVPQQALALSNSKLALAMAEKIAANLEKKLGKATDEEFARAAFRLVLALEPNAAELAACGQALARWRTLHAKDDSRRARLLLTHALLNHNDFVTVR